MITKTPSYQFSEEYIGVVTNNFWGNDFTLHDHGISEKALSKLPEGFAKQHEIKLEVKYERNILGECPRSQDILLWDDLRKEYVKLINLPPNWNERSACYTLNFYGRVSKASAKNFQIVDPEDKDTVYLMFGKIGNDNFHLDYRSPFSMLQAFAVGLIALARKRIVS